MIKSLRHRKHLKVIFRCSTYDHLGTLTGRNKGFCSIIPLCKGKTMAFYPAGKYHRIFFCQIRMYKGSTACKTGSVRPDAQLP